MFDTTTHLKRKFCNVQYVFEENCLHMWDLDGEFRTNPRGLEFGGKGVAVWRNGFRIHLHIKLNSVFFNKKYEQTLSSLMDWL